MLINFNIADDMLYIYVKLLKFGSSIYMMSLNKEKSLENERLDGKSALKRFHLT